MSRFNVNGRLIILLSRRYPVYVYQLNFLASSESIYHTLHNVTTRALQQISLPLGSCDRASWAECEERENQQDATIRCLSTSVSTCFGHHYAHLQANKDRVTAYGVLRWFCWMWLVAVVGRCVVGCEHCSQDGWTHFISPKHRNLAPWNMNSTAPHKPSYFAWPLHTKRATKPIK